MGKFGLWLVLASSGFVPLSTFAQEAVLAEYPLGAITVGWDVKAKQEVRRVAVVTVTAPVVLDAATQRIAQRNCAQPALAGWAEEARTALEQLPTVDSTLTDMVKAGVIEPTPADLANQRKARISQIGQYLQHAQPILIGRTRGCLPGAMGNTPIAVSLVLRTCTAVGTKAGHPCAALNGPTRAAAAGRGRTFSQAIEWMQGDAAEPPIWVTLQADKVEPGGAIILGATSAHAWSEPALDQSLRDFEAWVSELRRRKVQLAYTAPRAIGLTVESASHVLDILASPSEAIRPLRAGIQVFHTL